VLMYSLFVAICHNKRAEIFDRLGTGMSTSVTKVADNAIVGYCRNVLNINPDAAEADA
jgi:hypothetical protein